MLQDLGQSHRWFLSGAALRRRVDSAHTETSHSQQKHSRRYSEVFKQGLLVGFLLPSPFVDLQAKFNFQRTCTQSAHYLNK